MDQNTQEQTPQPQVNQQPTQMKPKTSKLPMVILVSVTIASLLLSGFLFYQNIQLKKQISSSTKTQNQESAESKTSVLYLKDSLIQHDEKGDVIKDSPFMSLAIDLPEGTIVTRDGLYRYVKIDSTSYKITIDGPGEGLCTGGAYGESCGYEDKKINEDITMRTWSENSTIFALNFMFVNNSIDGYEINHIVISKEEPTNTFSQQDVSLWENWITNIKAVESN